MRSRPDPEQLVDESLPNALDPGKVDDHPLELLESQSDSSRLGPRYEGVPVLEEPHDYL